MRFWTIFLKKIVSKEFHSGFVLDFALHDRGVYALLTNVLVWFPGQKAIWYPIDSVNFKTNRMVDNASFSCPLKTSIYVRKDLLLKPGLNILHKSILFPLDIDLPLFSENKEVVSLNYGLFNNKIFWSDFQFLGNSYEKLLRLHPIEVADMIQQLSIQKQAKILYKLDTRFAAFVLSEIDSKKQAPILEKLNVPCAVELLSGMPRNHAANILRDVGEASKYLNQMDEKIAEEIDRLLSYDPDTVGGLMDSEFIKLNQKNTCQEAVDTLRTLSQSSENIYYLYVVDDEGKFMGVLSSRALLISAPDVKLEQIMKKKLITIPETIRREEIAHIMSRYHLLALPVVDKKNRIVGVIKIHDVLESTLEYPI
jgi:CBS domain-containing protein